jgi:hypothetical protein
MSIKSWKAEFFPTKPKKSMTWAEAIEHSIRKWEGLTEENIEKHGITLSSYNKEMRYGKSEFEVGSNNCALCLKSTEEIYEDIFSTNCDLCPILKDTGRTCDYGIGSPWFKWIDTQDPKPMLKVLKKLRGKEWDSVMERKNTET